MKGNELGLLSAAQLAALIAKREASPVEVLDSILARIDRLEPRLNCYVAVLADQAKATARQAEQEIAEGRYRGPLHGVPIALKDLFDLAGTKTTGSSKILAENVARRDSAVARRLKEAGAVIVGKTNLHEFAFGVTTNNPHFGATRNPWDTNRIPGGSSGGSGAAVAASLCTAAMGSDTGGSIRIPAFFCGIVGLKPTFGLVSKAGALPLAWSLDTMGPMTKTVEDAALLLNALAGYDPSDPSSVPVDVPDYRAAIGKDVKGMRIGLPREHFFENVDGEVEQAVRTALSTFQDLGVEVEEVSLPHVRYAASIFPTIIQSEAAAYHEPWLLSRPQDYGMDVRGRLDTGRLILATEYINAQRARSLFIQDFQRALARVDAIVTPTVPLVAPYIGVDNVEVAGQIYETRAAATRFTSPINLTGLPALAVPCGFSALGLPIGMQLIGSAFAETTILALAHAYEANTEWHRRQPPI